MNQLKKTILTLVALLALTTGAWADDTYTVQFKANGNTKTVANVVLPYQFRCNFSSENGELDQIIRELYGWSGGYCNGDLHSSGNENVTCGSSDMDDYITISAPFEGTATVTGWYFNKSTNIKYSLEISIPGYVAKVNVTGVTLSETSAEMTLGGETLTLTANVAPANATNKTVTWTTSDESVATVANGVVTAVAPGTATITATATNGTADTSDDKTATCEVTVAAPAASSGPEVDWDKAKKTGTFTMPGGNVTLEPDYFPQAVAEGAVTAAGADARATTDDPLVKVDATKLTGAKKLMYFVSNSGTTAPAYDAEGWTEELPTAEGFTQQGTVYVWYYPVGTDEGVDGATATYSDGDICLQSITARIAAAPTYAVTFAEGTPETDKWTAEPNAGVTKGEPVTVTYTGSKKVIGVKAEKKAAEPVADIIWDGTNVTDLNVESTYASYTKEGVKLSGNADQVQVKWNNSAYLGTPGMEFITMESGGFTFTAPTGKAFTKIEMKAVGSSGWAQVNLGTGWAYNTGTVTWKGSAASTVKLLKDADMFSGDFISSIAFYLSE